MTRRLPLPLLIAAPVLCLIGGGAVGWLTADDSDDHAAEQSFGAALPAELDSVAPVDPIGAAPNPLGGDESMVIGLEEHRAVDATEVPAGSALEIPVTAGATAVSVELSSLQPSPAVAPMPPALAEATAMEGEVMASPAPTGIVREEIAVSASAPNALRVSPPFAAAGEFAELCDAVQEGNVLEPELIPSERPTLAVLVNQPSTMAISGTWADGATLEKTTMVTLPAHDDEWQRVFDETGQQASIVACLSLPIDEVRNHADDGVAQLRASVLAISAGGQADLNATVTLNVPSVVDDPFFVDQVSFTGRGEQRLADGVLYPTIHVHYAFLSDAVVPPGAVLAPGQVRVFGDHAYVEGADCAGWAANQQGIDRSRSGRFTVTNETRTVAGGDRAVTTVDGDVYLDPTLAGGWEGSFCVRLQATDQRGNQRSTLALRGAQVRSPRTATYAVAVLIDNGPPAIGQPVQVTWTSPTGAGCASTTLLNGLGAQCAFSARVAPDGMLVRLTSAGHSVAMHVPVNVGYCNPDDPLDTTDGCGTGFAQVFDFDLGDELLHVTLQVVRNSVPGVLWDDPSNAWSIQPVG